MKPYPYFRNRTFNVDAYLDEQLVQKVERPAPWPAPPDIHSPVGNTAYSHTAPDGTQTIIFALGFGEWKSEPRFRDWAVRLNDRIERWMESVDWRKWDIRFEKACSAGLAIIVLYLCIIVADAFVSGAVERLVR
jgi:hypothetical protein